MDVKSLRDREFNKRVRDVVSRDQNRLRETFDKYDKECAERMAEIHHMQEKVRFSMRSLAMDKIHINQANSVARNHRRSDESRVQSDAKEDHTRGSQVTNKPDDDGQESKQTKRDVNEVSKRHRASVTSMFSKPRTLDIPGPTTNRRASSPFALPPSSARSPQQPRHETTNNVYITGSRPTMSSSYPTTDGYMIHTLNKTPRSQPKLTDTHNMLSVNDMRMTTKSPVINLRRKSAGEVGDNRQVSERKGDRDCSPNHLRTDTRQRSTSVSHFPKPHISSPRNQRKLSTAGQKGVRDSSLNRLRTETRPVRQRSTSVSHLPNPHVSSPRNQRKLSATGQKVQLFRTRSNSLPDLLSPDSILTTTQQGGSAEDGVASKKSKDVQKSEPIQVGSASCQAKPDNSPLARSFEEMRHCRYLRCSDTDI
ncbi:uncharacterized protein LOC116298813 [Actinia tenebrosa]|uniref:Uncharacterized protein LOC116298813 n=1 Tax=Actinia tenebrosa TaxID=6105 RepID=A0A6P8ID56_ACTTE|nr:uncharacterized protein LOC116298813 [Actinia tenebrosa]